LGEAGAQTRETGSNDAKKLKWKYNEYFFEQNIWLPYFQHIDNKWRK
jgi:hypothetical protein